MDHKSAYAHHIAQAIRHKKAMRAEPKDEVELPADMDLADPIEGDELEESPADPKAARRERLKSILSR